MHEATPRIQTTIVPKHCLHTIHLQAAVSSLMVVQNCETYTDREDGKHTVSVKVTLFLELVTVTVPFSKKN